MSDADPNAPIPPFKPAPHDDLHGLDPGELLARGLNTVRRSGGAGGWEPPEPEELGRLLAGYRIEKLIGRGGMGAVYKAVQINLDRPVAIKLLPVEIAEDAEFVTRFKREARTLAKLQHSRIVTIHDFGQTTEGHLYFVMEYIDGTDLRRILKGPGLDPEQALAVVGQLCDAIQAAHLQGIVHRDIKPENVLVTKDGYVKLADFGLARPPQEDGASNLTGTNVIMGTANYMAPEQQDGAVKTDHRSDIFALGVMFYEMLTGQTPRGAFEPPSRRVQIDVRIDEVVIKALQSEPDRRYQRVSEMKTDVDRIRSTPMPVKPTATPPNKSPNRPPARAVVARKPRKALLPTFGICFLLLGIAGYFIWQKLGHPSSNLPNRSAANKSPTAEAAEQMGATKEKPFVNSLGMKFVPVPITGGPTAGQKVLFSVWDTRVQDYEVFVKETKREWPRVEVPQGPTNPATNLSWEDAQLFCQWLTGREHADGSLPPGVRYRLPSDHEWSCAVGIAGEDASKLPGEKHNRIKDAFPWDGGWPPPNGAGNYAGEELGQAQTVNRDPNFKGIIDGYKDGFVATSPVGSFKANRFGLFDMGGNVWQWCEDWLNEEHKHRVLRGASWNNFVRPHLLSSDRGDDAPDHRNTDDGFRCVTAPISNTAPPTASFVSTAPLNNATKGDPFVNSLGMKFVPVPITGGPTDGQRVLVSVWETRVQDYEVFAKGTRREWPKPPFEQGPTHPAVLVSWDDATAFCVWLTENERKAGRISADQSYRLPSDHEWSCAVGIGDREDPAKTPREKLGKITDAFPWGTIWPPPPDAGNYASQELQPLIAQGKYPEKKRLLIPGRNDGYPETAPVGSFAPNRLGLFDLGGNAYEWCQDLDGDGTPNRIMRGSEWGNGLQMYLLSSQRDPLPPSKRHIASGFRCALGSTVSASARLPIASSAPPAAATKDAPFVNSLGMKFVPVPGTKVLFSIWETRVRDYAVFAKTNKVGDAWTKQEKDGVPIGREPEHPVCCVLWDEAKGFCQWLTETEIAAGRLPAGARYRLPTDEEWSRAVGLGAEQGATPQEKAGRNPVDFPWGQDFPPKTKVGNFADMTFHEKFGKGQVSSYKWIEGYTDGFTTTAPVGSFPANVFGLFDMSGNVNECCEDFFDASQTGHVVRGGSWMDTSRGNLLSAMRTSTNPAYSWANYGFRCVLVPGSSTPPAVSLSSVSAKQAIDLLALVDAVKDRVMPGGMGKANEWEKTGTILRYKSDGRAGKVVVPVALRAIRYEIEVAYRSTGGLRQFHLDIPVGAGRIVPLILDHSGAKLWSDPSSPAWPADSPPSGRVVVRVDLGNAGAHDRLTVSLDGKLILNWEGSLQPRAKAGEPHPAFPDQPVTSLFCMAGGYEFTAWSLRVFEGEARVLREAASGASAATSGSATKDAP